MKTTIILGTSLIAIAGVLFFGFGLGSNKSELSFSKKFDIKIKADTLSSDIAISTTKFSQDETVTRLTKFSDFIEKQKHLKVEGGNFSVMPNTVYDGDGKSHTDGYSGNIGYNISSKDSKELNKFLRELQRLDVDEKVSVTINSVTWILSDAQRVGKSDELRLQAFTWADNYANEISDKLDKNCKVNKINLINQNDFEPMGDGVQRLREVSTSVEANITEEMTTAPTPTNEAQSLSINPSFTMVCK